MSSSFIFLHFLSLLFTIFSYSSSSLLETFLCSILIPFSLQISFFFHQTHHHLHQHQSSLSFSLDRQILRQLRTQLLAEAEAMLMCVKDLDSSQIFIIHLNFSTVQQKSAFLHCLANCMNLLHFFFLSSSFSSVFLKA